MENNMFDNPLSSQCLSLPELAKPQVEGALLGLSQAIPEDVLKKIRRVLITGCGDSYVAAQAAIPAFRKFAGRFGSQFSYARAIDAARFTDFSGLGGENALVIGVSCSGGPARISEVLERANRYGCVSLALTNNPESPLAQMADYRIITATREKLFTEEFWFSRVAATAVMEILYLLLMAGMPTAAGHVRRHEKAISADKQMEKRKE